LLKNWTILERVKKTLIRMNIAPHSWGFLFVG